MLRSPRYGRRLDDFASGQVHAHPWEVTVDHGMLALFAASFQDATPTFASKTAAVELGFRDRPVHPLVLLNLGISFSVHDVSEQAIANLSYLDVRFPSPCYAGDTLSATSRVLGIKTVSSGDKGVVHVRTELRTHEGKIVCSFERQALVRTGRVADRPPDPPASVAGPAETPPERVPDELRGPLAPRSLPRGSFATFWEDLEPGDVFAHEIGRTVSEAEHMQLTTLTRNSHPLHTDERYCKTQSFAKTRVVYGGLVLAWVVALTSRDTAGNAVWDVGLTEGAHPSGVLAGDTLFAATKVLSKTPRDETVGEVTLRIVGVKDVHPRVLLEAGADLFTPELGKTTGKVKEKVVEITRTLLVRRRGSPT